MDSSASRIELSPLNFLRARPGDGRPHGRRPRERRTYGELAERVSRLATALRGAGLERGERVAVLCPNVPMILESHFGVPAAGGILVTINTRLSSSEIEYILGDCAPRVLLVDHELRKLVDPSTSATSR